MYNQLIYALFGFLLGGALGSFASATAWAWLNGKRVWIKRSTCAACGNRLKILQLAPVASFLFLRGRCAFCQSPIPLFHFLLELVSACLCGFIAALHGPHLLTLCLMFLAVALATASATDIVARILPDAITLGCAPFCLCMIYLCQDLSLVSALIGYAAGGAVPLVIYWVFRILRHKEGLGLGDVKLFALGGGLTGWEALPFIFFFASVCGILAFFILLPFKQWENMREIQLPFGPFICAAILAALLFPTLPGWFYDFSDYWILSASSFWVQDHGI